MVVNPGLDIPKRGSRLKWVFLIVAVICLFLVISLLMVFRHYQMREVVEKPIIHDILNDTALSITVSSAESSSVSYASSMITRYSSSQSSSSGASSMSSLVKSLMEEGNNARQSLISTLPTTTTTLNYDYTSYEMKVPMKFKYCNPTTRKADNGTLIPPDVCLAIDASCCPCETVGIVDGEKRKIAWGGKIDFINEKYYNGSGGYFSVWLHNCTGFGVRCLMASTGSGCHYEAACINGICRAANRY
jgi:hypothetical protein